MVDAVNVTRLPAGFRPTALRCEVQSVLEAARPSALAT
jgi:hypothetical protein